MDSPGVVIRRLAEIEADLAERQNEYEQAAMDVARLKREWEHRYALAYAATKRDDKVDDRRSAAILALAAADDGLYGAVADSEARLAALKAVVSVLEARASIGQSILRAQAREQTTAPQPRWSSAA